MFNVVSREITWGETTLKIETGKIARQASGAVVVQMGDTMVLCTIVGEKKPRPEANFLPLAVHYQEKFYAAGKFPGGFIKREGKNNEREVLTSRLIDRPLRPLFPAYYHNEVQIICTVLSYDPDHNSDVLSIIGASAALAISGIPCTGVLAGARVGYKNGEFALNPSFAETKQGSLDLVIAGTKEAILMVESEAQELPEEIMLQALEFGHKALQPVIDLIQDFAAAVGMQKWSFVPVDLQPIIKEVNDLVGTQLAECYLVAEKALRIQQITELRKQVLEKLINAENSQLTEHTIAAAFSELAASIVRERILADGKRIDGRKLNEVRAIDSKVDLLPKAHGSSLFTRGETQALVVTTLGTTEDEQMTDDLTGNKLDNFMLHYNFPPYSVGEVGAMRAPGRREVGHGKLAFKALQAVLPNKESFPYTIRVVSEVTESNGSSSMATVCGASLAMMAAGIPLTQPVSGIAMGLVKDKDKFAILSDIMGDEDHLGDMDFKVAGTSRGITALQMDIKVSGIDQAILKQALMQAKEGRNQILEKMSETLSSPRSKLSPAAPRLFNIMIDKDKIREVIGTGGKVIREICDKSSAKIDIAADGKLTIFAPTEESIEIAVKMIKDIVTEPEVGGIYEGNVVKITNFGLFVKFLNNIEGMVHISEICNHYISDIGEVLHEGNKVIIKIVAFEKNGKIKLTMRNLDQHHLSQEIRERLAKAPAPNTANKENKERHNNKKEYPTSDLLGSFTPPTEPSPKKRRFF